VFTEHGAVMLASVLNSAAAVAASVLVVRAFIRLRTILATHKDLAHKLDALEQKCDQRFKAVFETIREILAPSAELQKRPIGFSVAAAKGVDAPGAAAQRRPNANARRRHGTSRAKKRKR
jgi:hypothetical protein